jgi:uncharacterized protein
VTQVTVIKLDHQGRETWRYRGELLEKSFRHIVLEAFFDRDDTLLDGLLLKRGDRFIETYYTDRWYNTFDIYDVDDGRFKGAYCNIGKPAEFAGDTISYRDLALDLIVLPDGEQIVVDEDEFEALPLTEQERQQARSALHELQQEYRQKKQGA